KIITDLPESCSGGCVADKDPPKVVGQNPLGIKEGQTRYEIAVTEPFGPEPDNCLGRKRITDHVDGTWLFVPRRGLCHCGVERWRFFRRHDHWLGFRPRS